MAKLEIEPPATAWDNIKSEIRPRKRFRGFWWFGGTLLLVGFLIFLNFQKQPTPKVISNPVNISEHKNVINPKPKGLPLLPGEPRISSKNLKNRAIIPLATLTLKSKQNAISHPRKPTLSSSNNTQKAEIKANSAALEPAGSTGKTIASMAVESAEINSVTNSENKLYNKSESGLKTDSAQATKQQLAAKTDSTTTKPAVTSTEKSQPTIKPDWFLGLVLSPTYSFKVVVPRTTDSLFITQIKNRNQFTKERLGLELGLQFTKPLSSKLHLEVGLSWLKLKENFTYTFDSGLLDSTHYTQNNPGQVQITPYPLLHTRQIISTYQFGSLRAGLAYYFREKPKSKLNVSLSGGVNQLLTSTTKQYYNGQLLDFGYGSNPDSLMAKANYNVSVGFGYTRPLGADYEFRIMPVFNYYLGSIYVQQEPYRLRPYSFGLHLTFKRSFTRKKTTTETAR